MGKPAFFIDEELLDDGVCVDECGPGCEPEDRYDCNGATTFQRDQDDCTTFYECDIVEQQPCPSHCPAGLVFNDDIKVCDWPQDVPECSGASKDVQIDDEVQGPACAPEERFDCQGSLDYVRDPNDCTTFYECDSNIQEPCPSHCPAGLVFNPDIQVCDWPQHVQC